MKRALTADAEKIRDLNALSVELEHGVCISEEGLDMLEPGRLYCGVLTGVSKDQQHVVVTWILATPDQLEPGDDLPVSEMSLPVRHVRDLPTAAINDETYEQCMENMRKFLAELGEEQAFWDQAMDEIDRLTGGNDPDNDQPSQS